MNRRRVFRNRGGGLEAINELAGRRRTVSVDFYL